jgi:hypothetical protein
MVCDPSCSSDAITVLTHIRDCDCPKRLGLRYRGSYGVFWMLVIADMTLHRRLPCSDADCMKTLEST